MNGDPHVLHDGHLPTPFTAAQIRAASPEGHTVEMITEQGGSISRARSVFVDPDHEGTTTRFEAIDDRGAVVGEPVEQRSAWTDLQAHASYPADVAQRSREVVEHPLGTLECLRYDVDRDTDQMTFWFSTEHPGMPVRYEIRSGGELVRRTTVTAIHDVP